jgi:hypothetical protein
MLAPPQIGNHAAVVKLLLERGSDRPTAPGRHPGQRVVSLRGPPSTALDIVCTLAQPCSHAQPCSRAHRNVRLHTSVRFTRSHAIVGVYEVLPVCDALRNYELTTCYSIGSAWFQRMTLEYNKTLSNVVFNFKLRRYTQAASLATGM